MRQHPKLSFHKIAEGRYGVFWCGEVMCTVQKSYPFSVGQGEPQWEIYGETDRSYPSRNHAAYYGIKKALQEQG